MELGAPLNLMELNEWITKASFINFSRSDLIIYMIHTFNHIHNEQVSASAVPLVSDSVIHYCNDIHSCYLNLNKYASIPRAWFMLSFKDFRQPHILSNW